MIFNDAIKRLARTRKVLSNAVFLYSNQRQRPYPFVSDNIHTSHNPHEAPFGLGQENPATRNPNIREEQSTVSFPTLFSQKKHHIPPKPTPDPCTMTGSGSQSSFTLGITASEKTPLADRKKKSTRKGFFQTRRTKRSPSENRKSEKEKRPRGEK